MSAQICCGDVLQVLPTLPDGSVDAVVTSPPYGDARSEYPPFTEWDEFFAQLRRVCTGPALCNVGRRWKAKVEQLWWVDILEAARGHGWELLDTLLWIKPNANPIHGQVVTNSHEYVFVLGRPGEALNVDAIRTPYAEETKARGQRYFKNCRGVKETAPSVEEKTRRGPLNPAGARPRSYFVAYVGREKGNPHPAPMPAELAEHLVKLGTWEGQTVLDPFAGSGTTLRAARALGRHAIGIEISKEYCALARERSVA